MSTYAGHGTRETSQREPIPGTPQVKNSAGGYVFRVDDWTRLERFLILGSEGGTYYVGERELTKDNADVVRRCLDENGSKTINCIVGISEEGRAVKNDPAIFALAVACGHSNVDVRRKAIDAIPAVCRTGMHLFTFASLVEDFRGWGRSLRRGVGAWYQEKEPEQLAYQLVKYRQRGGYTHNDLLRLSHPEPFSVDHDMLYAWATGKADRSVYEGMDSAGRAFSAIAAYERAQAAETPKETASLVREYGRSLPREAVKPEHMGSEVYEALVEVGMPMTALVRNLSNLGRSGVLKPMSAVERKVVEQFKDEDYVRFSKIHPIQVLSAMKVYASGGTVSGMRSRGETFEPSSGVVDALDQAFYASFGNVESAGKRTMLALDVSGSMGTPLAGVPGLDCETGAAAMAMVTARTEPQHMVVAFATGPAVPSPYFRKPARPYQPKDVWRFGQSRFYGLDNGIATLPLSPRERLDDVLSRMRGLAMGGTDCALPMLYAIERELEVDAFVVYTDSETWAGAIHPVQALQQYRQKSGIDASLVVVGMTATEFSIADPADPGMLDVVGFDTAAPGVIADFAAGRL